MLENRSFDHMLGFSGITGTDAATGQPTTIDGLNGTESNSFDGPHVTRSPRARPTSWIPVQVTASPTFSSSCAGQAQSTRAAVPTPPSTTPATCRSTRSVDDEGRSVELAGGRDEVLQPEPVAGVECAGAGVRGLRPLVFLDARTDRAQSNVCACRDLRYLGRCLRQVGNRLEAIASPRRRI